MVHRRLFFRRTILAGLLAIGCGVLPAAASKAGPAAPAPSTGPSRNVIVLLKDSVPSAAPVASEHARSRHARVTQVYDTALRGYAATVPDDQLAALRQDPRVEAVVADTKFHMLDANAAAPRRSSRPRSQAGGPHSGRFPQILPYSVNRVDADLSSTKSGDQRRAVDADVAVVDSGVGPHDDLNVVGGVNCGNLGARRDYSDAFGHGTEVSGVLGAKDDRFDYVGTAPGVRIWSVRVVDADGFISDSSLVCGMDWVARHSDVIEAANLSIGGDGSDDGNCGRTNNDPVHRAICRVVARGVTVVAAAGNEAANAATKFPASYDEVITVSAMTDCDGVPGGLDRDAFCARYSPDWCLNQHDDTRAVFTNFGPDVDLIAPGVCVESTGLFNSNGDRDLNGYSLDSGTSLAAPFVTGAAALYKSRHPHASPAQVRAALVAAGSFNYDDSWDPDGIKEPLLNMASF